MATVELEPEEKSAFDEFARDVAARMDNPSIPVTGNDIPEIPNIPVVDKILDTIGGGMLALPCSISGILGGLVGGLMGQIQGLIGGVMGTISNMLNTVSNFINGIGNMINNILAIPSKILQGIQTAIDNLITKAKDIIIQQINCASDLVASFINAPAALAQGIQVGVEGLWNSVISVGDKVAEIGHNVQAMGQQLLDQAFNMQDTLNKVFQGTIGSIASSFNSTLGGAISAISGIVTSPVGAIAKIGIGAVVGAIT